MALPKKTNWVNNVIDTWKDLLWIDNKTTPPTVKKPLIQQWGVFNKTGSTNEWMVDKNFLKTWGNTKINQVVPNLTWFTNNGLPSVNSNIASEINKLPTSNNIVNPVIPKVITPKVDTPTITSPTPPTITDPIYWWNTWELDKANKEFYKTLDDIKKKKEESIKTTKEDYITTLWEFDKNKSYIQNYSDISSKYTWVMNDLTSSIDDTTGQVPEAKYNELATKYWLSVDEIKNPKTIWDKASYTQEWKDKLWIGWQEDSMAYDKSEYDKSRLQLETNLNNYRTDINTSIERTKQDLEQSLWIQTALWVWSGASKSSAFSVWLDNIKKSADNIFADLQTQLTRMDSKSWVELKNLSDTYNYNFKINTKKLTDDLNTLKHNWMAWLLEIQQNYTWEKLKKALTDLENSFHTEWITAFKAYTDSVENIWKITKDNADKLKTYHDLTEAQTNKRFNELIDNWWLLLKNTSYKNIMDEYKSWKLTLQKAQDLVNIVKTNITWELWKINTLDDKDLTTIDNLLKQWKTPIQVLAEMQKLPKFTPTAPVDVDIKEIWGNVYKIDKKSWKYEIIQRGIDNKPIEVWGYIYQKNANWQYQNIWTWYQKPTTLKEWETLYDVTWNRIIWWTTIDRTTALQNYGSTPAVRNFNPWNIMDTWFWWQKVEWERFTRFDTPQEWFSALVSKIDNIKAWWSRVYSPDMTLLQYISKYAPSSDNNNPSGYANAIAKNLWISVNTQIKNINSVKLAEEHARHEDWNSYRMLKDLWVIWWWQTWWQWVSESDINKFAYADKLTDAWRQKYLKENNLENKYIDYQSSKEWFTPEENTQLSWILKDISWTAVNKEERAQWEKTYKDFKKQANAKWITWSDALNYIKDKISWYVYYKDSDKPILWALRKYSFWVNKDLPWEVAIKIKNWDISWAIENIETENFKKSQINPDYIIQTNSNLENIWWILNRIQAFEKQFWPVSWRIAQLNSYLQWDPEYQWILSDLTYSLAKTRNNIWGTSITNTELGFLQNIVPDNKDNILNVIAKLQSWSKNWMREINSYRQKAWLPKFEKPRQSYDINEKQKLYLWTNKTNTQTSWWNKTVSYWWKTYKIEK